jgi:hypothetical protein
VVIHVSPSQPTRLTILVIELAVLLSANRLAFNNWLPAIDPTGLWFYAALFGVLFGKRLDTPFFAKPADVVLYGAPTLLALFQASYGTWTRWDEGQQAVVVVAMAFSLSTTLIAAIAIWTKDAQSLLGKRATIMAKLLAETLGTPQVFFSVIFFCCVFAFNQDAGPALFWVFGAWAVTVAFSPIDHLLYIVKRVHASMRGLNIPHALAAVAGYQTPGVVLIRQNAGQVVKAGDVYLINDPHGHTNCAVGIDYVGRDDGVLLCAIDFSEHICREDIRDALSHLPPSHVALLGSEQASDIAMVTMLRERLKTIVGLVARETSAETLRFEVTTDVDLEEGRIVETEIAGRTVAYQIIDGLTKEEMVQQKNARGYVEARAQKLGTWDSGQGRFLLARWLPTLNTPLFLKPVAVPAASPDVIGRFPRSDYTVAIRDIHQLVTHNAAILGILGVGKSMLAIELVERMIASEIKVICLDLTNQYAKELSPFYDAAFEVSRLTEIAKAGEKDQDKWDEDPQHGGSVPAFSKAIFDDLAEFVNPANPRMLKIYNPAQLFATKQLADPRSFQVKGTWHRRASLWGITPVEVTRIVLESILSLLHDKLVDDARVCLVYEEAHSLIPEWNSVASEGDREATNGTARAILQGCKFGLGCLVVTQRTANVTKTILNQCNAIFAMRTFDATAKEFLASYIGDQYTAGLSLVPERHAVIFGRAFSSENPVLLELNDRAAFLRCFRDVVPPRVLPIAGAAIGETGYP